MGFVPTKRIDLQDDALRLVLAAADMRHAAAAARLLRDGVDQAEADKARALETAIAVSYWRPWSQSNTLGSLKQKWRPEDRTGLELHGRLEQLRNETYAHTQRGAGRKASAHFVIRDDGSLESLGVGEEWDPLPREVLPAIIELCEKQADRFVGAAFDLALKEL